MTLNYLKPLSEPVWDNIQVRAPRVPSVDSTFGFERSVSMTSRRRETGSQLLKAAERTRFGQHPGQSDEVIAAS